MGARTKARKRALDVLYAAELRVEDPVAFLEQQIADGRGPPNEYTEVLVRGVVAERCHLDELLSSYSRDWTLDRMPAIDRNVLRIGAWEILFADDVPDVVALSEAMALVGDLSTDDSPAFVNAILDTVKRHKTDHAST